MSTLEATRIADPVTELTPKTKGRWLTAIRGIPKSRMLSVAFSFLDQTFAVGGSFLANVVLARTETKEEYGMFALSYSLFTFLSGLHNALILEPFTVYGSGRYRNLFSQYLRLILRLNALCGLLLTTLVLLACLVVHWFTTKFVSPALLGLGVTIAILLSGTLLRRVFYLQRQPALAAQASLTSFIAVAFGLWLAARFHALNGFSVFVILALGWITAGVTRGKKLSLDNHQRSFLDSEPGYWRQHWQYSRWVFATALVFQLTTQGYYWLLAGFLSVKEVAELRAMYLIVSPVEQVFIALTLIVLPALSARYASQKMSEFRSLLERYGLGVLATTAVFALAVRIGGKFAIHLLYRGKFDDLAPLLYLLAFLPLLLGISNAMSCGLNAAERPRVVFYGYLSSGAATFIGGVPLVIHFGLLGAVYGMLFSAAVFTGTLIIGFSFGVWGGPVADAKQRAITQEMP